MLFSSYAFVFVFLPVVTLAFGVARLHSARAAIFVLVAASLYFYASWRQIYLLLLLGSIAMNYGIGLAMHKARHPAAIALAGVLVNLAGLAYFKYATFLTDNLALLLGTPLSAGGIVLPIGISFFTFQQIAYLLDVKRGAHVERDVVSFSLFVTFFPHLIAGPLVHHAEMIPQFKNERRRRYAVLAARGIAIAVAGLFKKVVLADSFAQLATPAFAHVDSGGAIGCFWAWVAVVAYALQIYLDFSGYSDMAVGLALIFGIRLPVNFRSPYKACSIIDFWRRWHITLSRFLRDYLYIPLGGNRSGKVRRYLNVLVTMVLGGLWHGAGWTFIVWGTLHGICLVGNHLWRDLLGAAPGLASRLDLVPAGAGRATAWCATFMVVLGSWVFFRATTMHGALAMLVAMSGQGGDGTFAPSSVIRFGDLPWTFAAECFPAAAAAAVVLALAGLLIAPSTTQIFRYREYRRGPDGARTALHWRPDAVWALVTAGAFTACIFGMRQRLEFLYFQF